MNVKDNERNKEIIKYNFIGIVMNLLLAGVNDNEIEKFMKEIEQANPDMHLDIRMAIDM